MVKLILKFMPKRKFPLRNSEIYHVFNRGIDKRKTFIDDREFARALMCMNYYLHKNPTQKLSTYLKNENQHPSQKTDSETLVDLIAYCFMDNHFHLLIRQKEEGGTSKFLSNFQNSYTRYFNTKHDRSGPLFSTQFKAVHIENDNQLIHISRYIHLNPYTSGLVHNFSDLISYPWSSLNKYLDPKSPDILKKNIILSNFRSLAEYKRFILNQAHYQKTLKKIEDLILDD